MNGKSVQLYVLIGSNTRLMCSAQKFIQYFISLQFESLIPTVGIVDHSTIKHYCGLEKYKQSRVHCPYVAIRVAMQCERFDLDIEM
jgi:hypothetical protein